MRVRTSILAAGTALTLTLTACGLPTPPTGAVGAAGNGGVGNGAAGNGAAVTAGNGGGGIGGIALPGLGGLGGCIGVGLSFANLMLAIGTSALTGAGTYNGASVNAAITQLRTSLPSELQPDVDTLANAAQQANGKTLAQAGDIFDAPDVSKATDAISDWVDKNCGGTETTTN